MKISAIRAGFISLLFFILSGLFSTAYAATAGGINVGPNYGEMSQAAGAIGSDGWIYVLGCPGDLKKIEEQYKNIPNAKLMVRAFLRGGQIGTPADAQKMADDWAKAFRAMDTHARVYFMPANEINNPVEGFVTSSGSFIGSNFEGLKTYINTLKSELPANKVIMLSPSIDPFFFDGHVEIQRDRINEILGLTTYAGFSVSLYGQYAGGHIDTNAPGVKRGDFTKFTQAPYNLHIPNDIYAVETGVITVEDGHVEYGKNAPLIADYLTQMKNGLWSGDRLKAAIIFSYNPDGNFDKGWIYQHGDVISALQKFQAAPPRAVWSTSPENVDLTGITAGCANDTTGEKKEVSCTVFNKKTELDAKTAINIFLLGGGTSVGTNDNATVEIGKLTPGEPSNKITNLNHNYLNEVNRGMAPRSFALNQKDGKDDTTGTVTDIDYNDQVAPYTTRAKLCAPQGTTNGTNSSGTDVVSVGNLYNATDSKERRLLTDNNEIGSAFLSRGKIQPAGKTANLRKPAEILAEEQNIDCNANGSGDTSIPKQDYSNTGENDFTVNGQSLTFSNNIVADALSSVLAWALSVFAGNKDQQTAFLNGLGIPMYIVSCTYGSQQHTLTNKTTEFTGAHLPRQIAQKTLSVQKDAQTDIKYNPPYVSNDPQFSISTVLGDEKLIDTRMHLTECASLPSHTNLFKKLCSDQRQMPDGSNPGTGIGSGTNGPQNCTAAFMQDAFGAEAEHAQCIARAETSQCTGFSNTSCLCGPNHDCSSGRYTLDYSIGLFQLNMLAHPWSRGQIPAGLQQLLAANGLAGAYCPDAFSSRGITNAQGYMVSACQVSNQKLLDLCTQYFMDPQNNKEYAASVVKNPAFGWSPWATHGLCGL